jgi:O-antigen/teichoic acid export membrane protein
VKEESRSRERYRRVAMTAIANAAARMASLIVMLISVPLALHYLGKQQYGLWITIVSLVALLNFADLGLANGLVSAVSRAEGEGDSELSRRLISSAYVALVGVTCVFAVMFSVLYGLVPWADFANVSSPEATAAAGPSVAVAVGCFLASIPLGVVSRVQFGLQEGFVTHVWLGIGNVLGLVGLAIGISSDASLPWLVLAVSGGPVVALLLNNILFYATRHRDLVPKLRYVTRTAARQILGMGSLFFVIQIGIAVAYQSDAIVVARVLGADSVPEYAVPMRLFFIPLLFVNLFLSPLWPAYSEAIGRRDFEWVRKAFRRSVAVAFSVGLGAAALLLLVGRPVIRVWAGSDVVPGALLLSALALWTVVMCISDPLAMLLNGAHVLRRQAVAITLMMGANIVLSITLTRMIGVSGVVWGTVFAQIIFFLIPSAIWAKGVLADISWRTAQHGVLPAAPAESRS